MYKYRKKLISAVAVLMALLYLIPTDAAAAVTTTAKRSEDSGIYWTSTLPTDGDFSYKTDGNWYRLVLEWGEYTSNRSDSEGKFVSRWAGEQDRPYGRIDASDWSKSDFETLKEELNKVGKSNYDRGNSWPSSPFNNYWGTWESLEGMKAAGTNENWYGNYGHQTVVGGTKKRAADSDLYANGEYSEDGMLSLYIKCAGQDDKGEYCYYIAPCDDSGHRDNCLWVLDCCLDACYTNYEDSDEYAYLYETINGYGKIENMRQAWKNGFFYVQNSPWAKSIAENTHPTFTLLTAGIEEVEKDKNLTHAGIAAPCVDYLYPGQLYRTSYDEPAYYKIEHTGDNSANDGMIVGEYKNNYKWYIKKSNDGGWTIRSAGSIEWDWSDTNGTFVKIFDDPASALENALSVYAKVIAYETLPNLKSRSDSGKEYDIIKHYYIDPWCSHEANTLDGSWLVYENYNAGNNVRAEWVVPMLFLTDYAQNVYITGGYEHTETWLDNNGGNLMWTTSVKGTPKIRSRYVTEKMLELFKKYGVSCETGSTDGAAQLCCSYGMEIKNTGITAKQLDKWIDAEIDDAEDMDSSIAGKYYMSEKADSPKDETKIKVYGTTADADGSSEDDYEYYTVEEIKKNLPFTFKSNYTPTLTTGAFSALYVGVPLNTECYDIENADIVIQEGVTKVLGATDKNADGACDGMAYIGKLSKHALYQQSRNVNGPTITVEKGASLYIDGPTFATLGTTIEVRGTMYVNPGAFLSPENVRDTSLKDTWYRFIRLRINGGTVIVSKGAMLDIGDSNLEISNDGSLINNGVFIQGTDSKSKTSGKIAVTGGAIENYCGAWFISGANVLKEQRMALLNGLKPSGSLSDMAKYVTDVYDGDLQNYPSKTFESGAGDTYVQLRMYGNMIESFFRNNGSAFISGAIKGTDENRNHFMGNGKLYRAKDLYSGSITVSGTSLTAHSGRDVNTDEGIKQFYSLYGVSYSETNTIEDETGETEAMKKNILALRVGTGSQGTEQISSFKITYVDNNKNERTEYLDPGGLKSTYDLLTSWNYCGDEENQRGDSALRSFNGGSVMSGTEFPTGLEAMSDEIYLFQTTYPAAYVKSISVMGRGSDSWVCTGLAIYRVRTLYPMREYGLFSEDWYVPFKGTLMADITLSPDSSGLNSLILSWTSEDIEFGTKLYQLNVYDTEHNLRSLQDDTGFVYYNVSDEKISYSTVEEDYTFSVSLADADGAGIESLYNVGTNESLDGLFNSTTWTKKVREDIKLDMELVYIDTIGSVRKVTLPLIQSTLQWVYNELDEGSRRASLHGLFQQGEEMVFTGTLPDFDRLVETHINYEDENAGASIAVSSITISQPSYISTVVSNGILKIDFPDSALFYYRSLTESGVYVSNGQYMNVEMQQWNGTDSLRPQSQGSKYLVVVKTDEMSSAATANDIAASFTYKTISGVTSTTGTYELRNLVNDYYGYWRDVAGNDVDCAYRTAVSAGGEMYFVIEVPNLYSFTSATFSMAGTATADDEDDDKKEETGTTGENPEYAAYGKDEWQMSAITIYELSALGERQVDLSVSKNTMGISTNRIYFRDNRYGSRGAINRAKGPLMIGPGASKTVNFESGGTITGGGELIGKNNATNVTSLSYSETKQDFGFIKKRAKYNIIVKVDGTSITSVEDGDCGSKNQFYFQLVFQDENGKLRTSPCVLSNQQLQSDGFRTGTEEEFCIYTNDDYGTPVQINVIPDDTSSISDVFDKLCIDTITVSKTSGTGVNLNWKAEKVGWIDIEYKDDAEEQEGRSRDKLVRSFELQEAGYKVWIEFGIETAAEYIDGKQYVGQMLADIVYRDPTGALRTRPNVAVVGRIADYAERMSEVESVSDGTENSVASYMFRNGYTNRFLVEFEDISSLVSIKLKATPKQDSSIAIKRVSARQVFDQGNLSLNIYNEYERKYSVDPQNLASTSNVKALKIEPKGGTASGTLTFNSGNSIIIDQDDPEGTVTVKEGASDGINDVISITAELSDVTGLTAANTLPVRVIYKDIYGDAFNVNTVLVYDAESSRFMIPENELPKTPDIGVPYQVEVTGGTLSGRGLEAVTVNQIRDRELLEQFLFAPSAGTVLGSDVPVVITLPESEQDEYAKRKGYTTEKQVVYLQLGAGTAKTLLSEAQDLQLYLKYTAKNDPYEYELESDPVSVLDQGYAVIQSGSILRVSMNAKNVGAIKSLMLKTTEQTMQVNAQEGCIAIEETSNLTGRQVATGWVNLPGQTGQVSNEGTAMNSDGLTFEQALTSNTRISPVCVSANVKQVGRSDAQLAVELCYADKQEISQTIPYSLTASEWNYGDMWFLTKGLQYLQYLTINAYDSDTTNIASVTIGSMSASCYNTVGEYVTATISTETVYTEGAPVMHELFSTGLTGTITLNLTGTVTFTDGTMTTLEGNLISEGRTDYATNTTRAAGTVTVTASLPYLPGDLELIATDTATGAALNSFVVSGTGTTSVTWNVVIPSDDTNSANTTQYSIVVRSKSFPEKYAAKVLINKQAEEYLEYIIAGADGTIPNGYPKKTKNTASDIYWSWVKAGDTITIYARSNYESLARFDLSPRGMLVLCRPNVTQVTLPGYEGTWTKIELPFTSAPKQTEMGRLTLSPYSNSAITAELTFYLTND